MNTSACIKESEELLADDSDLNVNNCDYISISENVLYSSKRPSA